ncbi:hypothetical protein AB0A95_30795 [Micromonospora sp. NPDC049230]|uniref:hypothetical protein n=1 Tax=Micromonospora sp. NPDC049230 TaxID=3155502 RepID=UPI0033FB3364
MTTERAAKEIRRAYGALAGTTPDYLMSLVDLRNMVDLTTDEITAGVIHLLQADRNFVCWPESNQKVLRPEERIAAIRVGNQPKHWIGWG